MRKFNLLLLMMTLLSSLTAYAGDQFVAKDYTYNETAATFQVVRSIDYANLFEFPDGIDAKTNLTTIEDIDTIYAVSSNEELITIYDADYWYAYQSKMQLMVTKLKNVKGSATVDLTIVYKGEAVTNSIKFNIPGATASSYDAHILPDVQPDTLDVIKKANYWKGAEKTTSTITIDNLDELKCGTAKVITNDGANDVIEYTPNAGVENFSIEKLNYTITLPDGETTSATVTLYIHKNTFATKVLEYVPAAGQFRCEGWDNPLVELGDEESMINMSLGGLGGYIVFGFDQPIYNNPQNPYGVDFAIQGNSFVANLHGVWTEPGAVQVMEDKNGDGIPNDGEWYELAGSDYYLSTTKHNVDITYYNPSYNKRYTVPWTMTYTDNNGERQTKHGALLSNQYHSHTYYPDYFYNCDNPDPDYRWYTPGVSRDSVTIKGINEIRGCIDMRTPSYIEFYRAAGFGYFDNKGYNKTDLRIAQNPYGNPEYGEDSYDGFDLSWAVDKDGNHVELEKVDFVRLYTAGNQNAGWLGEWSSEVINCTITLPDPDYVPQDYYMNYAGITQLQVPKGQTCQYEGILFKNGRPVEDAVQKWWIADANGEVNDSISALAEIDNTGLLKAKDYGTVYVHFTAMEGLHEEVFEVNISKLTSVLIDLEGNASVVSNDSLTCIVNERVFINVQSTDDNTGVLNGTTSNRYIYDTYTWENSNPEVGTMDNGTFRALKPGVTMLTVRSNTDKSLTDQIKVIVNDIPEISLVQNPIRIPYNAPTGELLNSDIFSTGNNATVYMDEVTIENGLGEISLYNNHLTYAFTEGEYGTDTLHFKTTCYGVEKDFDIAIIYGPDNFANSKQLLLTDNTAENTNTLAGIEVESFATSTYVDRLLGEVSADNLITDGAYAYVAQGTTLARYKVSEGEQVANGTLASTAKHLTNIYKDKILVSDGNLMKVFYKTDLEAFRTIELAAGIKQVVVSGDVAYILTADENGLTYMNVLDLTTFTLTSQDLALEGGSNAAAMYLRDAKLYIPTGATETANASMIVFNTTDHTAVSQSATLATEGATNNIAVLADSTVMVSTGKGFVAYDLATETFGEEVVMAGDVMPTLAAGEAFDVTTSEEGVDDEGNATTTTITSTYERYYVIYGNILKVFESDAIAEAKKELADLCVAPTALNLMAATNVNSAPTVKKQTSTYTAYELATSATYGTWMYITTVFNDSEGNHKMYVREDADWLDITYYDNGNLRPSYKYTGTVDEKVVYTFPVECIDDCGASVMAEMAITITPRIYRPTINEVEMTIYSSEEPSASIAVTDIFNYTQSKTSLTFVTEVTAISDTNLISSAEVDENDNLVVTVPTDFKGEATIELTQTITHKTYGSKQFTTTVPVTVISNVTDGLWTVNAADAGIYYSDGILNVNGHAGAAARIFDVAGSEVAAFNVITDSFSTPLQLNTGIYVVVVDGNSVKIAIKQ